MGLKGTKITYFYDDGTAEIIPDVLIGEPANGGREFTLGIPKGDLHDWLDKRVNFFGRNFYTQGSPDEGIEENIPLKWHKKVHVRVLGSGKVTVWEKRDFTRHLIENVEFYDLRGISAAKDMELTADRLTIKIPSCSADHVPKAGDIIAVGEFNVEIAADTPEMQSKNMAEFRKTVTNSAIIENVIAEINGRKYNYILTAR